MKAKRQESRNTMSSLTQFRAVYKSDFFLERKANPHPNPSLCYHYHDCYEMYYLYSGERYYFIKDKTYHIKSGSLVFIEPHAIHCSANFEESGYDRLLFNFKKEYINELLLAAGLSDPFEYCGRLSPVIQLDLHERAFAESLFETMLAEQNTRTSFSEAYMKSSLVQILLFVSKSGHQLEAPPLDYASATHRMISEITGYINNNFANDISLTGISDLFHISPCYFSRTFKKSTGFSFTEYLNSVRVKEAQKHLTNSDISIMDVAQTVGFKSNSHFGRVFKKLIGISPLEYRKCR